MSDKNAKKFIIATIITPIVLGAILLSLIYIYDPLQIFHKSFFYMSRFFGEIRTGAKGIREHYEYD